MKCTTHADFINKTLKNYKTAFKIKFFKMLLGNICREGNGTPLPWKIPWMEEPGRLQSMGLRRVGHD